MIFIFLGIFVLSLTLAIGSMKDFEVPHEVSRIIRSRKRGSIVFFKDKIRHYSSKFSSSSSSSD